MTPHLNAKSGDYAEAVLLPGDPLRAAFIAETFFDGPRQVNTLRGMSGFTGSYQGMPVSVQATGMGMPSASIYIEELIRIYGARTLLRVGTCGSFQEDLHLGDIVMASTASTDSSVNRLRFGGRDFAPAADFHLLRSAFEAAETLGQKVHVGGILSTDTFYGPPDAMAVWAAHGVLAAEMESSALYTLAARHGARALTLLTVSDEIAAGIHMDPRQREQALDAMLRVALEALLADARARA
jgi:purine-nucleoside phosphorylase